MSTPIEHPPDAGIPTSAPPQLRTARARIGLRVGYLLAVLLVATGAWAGDPIPDIDIVLEQIPGGSVKVDSLTGGFDELEVEVGKQLAQAMRPVALPAGWTLQADGKTVRLSGPALPAGQPVRFKLDVGSAPRPSKISYRANLEGRELLERRKEEVVLVPAQQMIGSLRGIVTMPSQVAPGEPMQMTVLDSSALPPGGTWSLSGTVVAEEEEEESEAGTPGEPKDLMELIVAAGNDVPDAALDQVAATLAAMGTPGQSWEVVPVAPGDVLLDNPAAQVWTVEADPAAPATQSVVAQATHEAAQQALKSFGAEIATAPRPGTGSGVYSVRPSGTGVGSEVAVQAAGIQWPLRCYLQWCGIHQVKHPICVWDGFASAGFNQFELSASTLEPFDSLSDDEIATQLRRQLPEGSTLRHDSHPGEELVLGRPSQSIAPQAAGVQWPLRCYWQWCGIHQVKHLICLWDGFASAGFNQFEFSVSTLEPFESLSDEKVAQQLRRELPEGSTLRHGSHPGEELVLGRPSQSTSALLAAAANPADDRVPGIEIVGEQVPGRVGPVIVVTGVTIEQEEVNAVAPAPQPNGITIEEEKLNVAESTAKVTSFILSGSPAKGDSPAIVVNPTRSDIEYIPQVVRALAGSDGKVIFDNLPTDLEPGGGVSMQYVDQFGDVVADVPSVEGLEVVEPRGDGEARITDATPRSFAGQSVCVCGTYPGQTAWNALLLDGQAVGSPASASGQIAWVELPAGLAPGEHVFTGTATGGFPAADRASTLVLGVGGEIDSSKLQRLETTPMRLWVTGTEEPVDLRVRNLTPAIISIDGGDDQTIRTSGGAPNLLERTVRGLSPGAFDIKYELAAEPCPCESQIHYF